MAKFQSCQPPYTITPAILNLVAQIGEAIGRLTVLTDQAGALRLRRINVFAPFRAHSPSKGTR